MKGGSLTVAGRQRFNKKGSWNHCPPPLKIEDIKRRRAADAGCRKGAYSWTKRIDICHLSVAEHP